MNKYKTFIWGLAASIIVFTICLWLFLSARADATFQLPQPPSHICHAIPPDTAVNGWNKISPSIPQLVGHIAQHDADIIPPFGQYGGKNWNEEGQAIWENDCEVPVVDVCENLEGIQEETPEGYENEQGYCYIPEEPKDYCDTLEGVQGEDEDCPREETPPVEEPKQPHVEPTFAGSSTNPPAVPVCAQQLDAPELQAYEKLDPKTVRWHWWLSTDSVEDQWLEYGNEKGVYPYSVLHIPVHQTWADTGELNPNLVHWGRVCVRNQGCVVCSNDFDP